MKKILIFIATFAISCLVSAQQLVNSGEYWFDDNYSSRTSLQVTPSANFFYNSGIDCNALSTGLHVLNMRFRQTDGRWSSMVSHLFLKTPPGSTGDNAITAYEYWPDNAYASKVSQAVSPSANFNLQTLVDFGNISTGIHVFNVRFKQSNGCWSSVSSQIFLRVPPDTNADNRIIAYEYWLNDSYQTKVSQPVSPADNYTFISGIDFSTVPEGNHEFNIRFKQSNGAWSSVISQIFVKVPLEVNSYNIVGYEYWLDNAYSQKVSQAITPTANYFFASGIDLGAVSTGIHSFNMRFKQSNGHWSGTVTQMFMKQPVLEGINAITTYEYWINENFEDRTTINTPPEAFYTAINNLNIESSDQFLNIFHSRFKDRNNAYNYVDEYFYSINLDISVFLEGLFETGTGSMRKAQNESGDHFAGNIADTVTIQIREGTAPYNVLLNFHGMELHTDGTCHIQKYGTDLVNLPNTSNTTYYIVVKHRNSIETWSQAVELSSNSSYNFTDSDMKAYGNNLKAEGGTYLIFSGDVNQDGVVDTADMTPVDNDSANYASGYLNTDVNGDGIIDTADMTIVDNNAAGYTGSVTP
jgi:hypothetical protein